MLLDFNTTELIFINLIFCWAGFVRTGLGFGGAALGLPLLLFINGSPVYWLPIIGIHLLLFSSLTLSTALKQVDWIYLKKTLKIIIPSVLVGITGLLNLPDTVLLIFIYSVTIFYSFIWILNKAIHSKKSITDTMLLIFGGYVAGVSLTGAPLIVSVFMRYVIKSQLRNTLFVLWFILVSIKMLTFVIVGTTIDWQFSLYLIPVAIIGHIIGLKTHQAIMANDLLFKKLVGGGLLIISSIGLLKIIQ